ncbi:MAG TPA: histidine-type phosphatase [Terracidiphilus sp.]|nr:histidine-type phosphatase [Terracidiphilus sp.]
MLRLLLTCRPILLVCIVVLAFVPCLAQAGSPAAKPDDAELKFVVILSRHGVRSPTDDPGKYDAYSSAPWPRWSVPPGYLTEHGFELMKLFGAYDRVRLAQEGLIAPSGCADASQVTFVADSDQRTRESARALADGMFPDCQVAVQARPESEPDPLFHSMRAGVGKPERALAAAAMEGRIGGDGSNLTSAYRPQLQALDGILAGCGRVPVGNAKRTSIFDVRSTHGGGKDDAAKLHGPLAAGSSMAEILLLEYAEGMKGSDLGWGCLDENKLPELMQLHTAQADYAERTLAIARMDASNLLEHILAALQQSATSKPVAGAPGKPGDRALFLVGHDTNIATVAGVLHLNWIIDSRRDDTPPGGALVFELWRSADGSWSVRLYYTAQTLRQMREGTLLTLASPPERVPVFVPGCSGPDMSCALDAFAATVRGAVDPGYVSIGASERASSPGSSKTDSVVRQSAQ